MTLSLLLLALIAGGIPVDSLHPDTQALIGEVTEMVREYRRDLPIRE
jgi:hypothetical protein